jgi:hypothetical protein
VKLLPPEAPMCDPVTCMYMSGSSVITRVFCFSFLISHFLIQYRAR